MMLLRFSPPNWERFETHNKKTTIRTRRIKPGVHTAGKGSPQWRTWVPWPQKVYVYTEEKACKVCELTEQDAKDDGFDSLCELLLELGKLNRGITAETTVYKHPVIRLKDHALPF